MAHQASEAITPEVLERLDTAIKGIPVKTRPSRYRVEIVLFHLARRARPDGDGNFTVNEAVSQIVTELCWRGSSTRADAGERMVKRCLDAIAAAGLLKTISRGGSSKRVGSTRRLTFVETRDGLTSRVGPVDIEGTQDGLASRVGQATGDAQARTGDAQGVLLHSSSNRSSNARRREDHRRYVPPVDAGASMAAALEQLSPEARAQCEASCELSGELTPNQERIARLIERKRATA